MCVGGGGVGTEGWKGGREGETRPHVDMRVVERAHERGGTGQDGTGRGGGGGVHHLWLGAGAQIHLGPEGIEIRLEAAGRAKHGRDSE